jgi:diguanylate cyclase (GGDEF)-like protein/PAS domain S-box-containing protein
MEAIGRSILFLIRENISQSKLFHINEVFCREEELILKKIQNGEELNQYETKRHHKDGRLIDVLLTVSPIKNKGGRIIGLSEIAHDITERKVAEQALFKEKELAQITLRSIGDAVITTDPHGNVTLLNPIAEIMTGWTTAQAMGCPLQQVFNIVNANTRQPSPNPIHFALAENRRVGLPLDTVLIARHGKEAAIEDSASPIHDLEGNIVGGVLVFRDISETQDMAIRMTYLAQHDFLTDLPNRVLLHDRLEQAISVARRNGKNVAVLFIDLDRFKQVNDSLGHAAGDKLLKQIAGRLKACVRESDTICRQGGDEFVAVLSEVGDTNDVSHIAEKLRNACAQVYMIDGHEVNVSVSIGISLFPHDGGDIDTLSRNADAAMYHAKEIGRNNFQFYTPDMNARAHEGLALENDLRRALRENEFVLHYQPIFDLATQSIIACEALIRWQQPNRGLVLPDDFLPLAESNGLIIPISQWALQEACRQNQAWQARGLLASVKKTLAETGLDPQYLDLEITETTAMCDAESSIGVLRSLKDMGIHISIDDFGTGYSSLSYLRRFPIDTIKIDRSFVHDLTTNADYAAITSAIISMAKSLRQRVVAEGVENSEQLKFLSEQSCDAIQGFYYKPALSADEFAKLLI